MIATWIACLLPVYDADIGAPTIWKIAYMKQLHVYKIWETKSKY